MKSEIDSAWKTHQVICIRKDFSIRSFSISFMKLFIQDSIFLLLG